MIVVDTNVIVCTLIEGPQTVLARRVYTLDPIWRLPDLWRHECLNVLSSYVNRKGMALDRACTLWNDAVRLFGHCSRPVDMIRALRLAASNGISTYDAQFVSLAQQLNVICVTEDRRLQVKFPELAVSMRAVCAAAGPI